MFVNVNEKQKAALTAIEKYIDLSVLQRDITAVYAPQKTLEIEVSEHAAKIVYGKESLFFKGLSYLFAAKEKSVFIKKDKMFERLGVMLDCARNGVPNIASLKRFIVNLAFCGYDYLGLYLEDCFEVDGEPLFGYMRGRYRKEELREIVAFADLFGIEVVPYIQTLAHLPNIFHHWKEYFNTVRDFGDILLVDEPRTYVLIENMLKTVSQTFLTKRVNVGMDEAFMLSLGKYRKLHGETNLTDVLVGHVRKVCDACAQYGLVPTAWSDMFEHRTNDPDFVLPVDLGLSVWGYDCADVDYYTKRIRSVRSKVRDVSFTAAVHKWYGYAPLNEYTQTVVYPAMDAAYGNVKDFCVAMWGDDGAECSYNACWSSLFAIAAKAFEDEQTESDSLSIALTGYTMQEWRMADLPNKVFSQPMTKPVNVSKYILFEDVFYGISDRTASPHFAAYFETNANRLGKLAKKEGEYARLFKIFYRLCKINRLKTDIRIRALENYKHRNYQELLAVAEDLKIIVRDVKALKKDVETAWLEEYKPFGLEVQQIRLAGLAARLQYCADKIKLFCAGTIDRIEELDEADVSPKPTGDNYTDAMCFNSYEQNVTYCQLTNKITY